MQEEQVCPPYRRAAEILGKRWTPLILWALKEGPRRFTHLTAYVPGLSDHVLSQRLQELERHGIVGRRIHEQRPVLVEYTLTEKGRDLAPVVEALHQWAERWENPDPHPPAEVPPEDAEGEPFDGRGRRRP